MELIVDVMYKGGPFMWPILALAIVGGIIPLVLAALVAAGRRVPAPLWWLVPTLVVVVGVLGTLMGLSMGREALRFASFETQSVLAHAAYSTALFTLISGCIVAAGLLTLSAVTAAIGGLVSGGGSGTEDNAIKGQRLADLRLTVAGLAVGATALSAVVVWMAGEIMLHEAFAHASSAALTTLAWAGLERAAEARVGGALAIGLVAALGAAGCAPVARRLLSAWSLVNLGLVGLCGLAIGGGLSIVSVAARPILDAMVELQIDGLRDAVPDLPIATSRDGHHHPRADARPVTPGRDGWVWYDTGEPVALPIDGEDPWGFHVTVAAPGSASARALVAERWFPEAGYLSVIAAAPMDTVSTADTASVWLSAITLRSVRFRWEAPADFIDPDGRVYVRGEGGGFVTGLPDGEVRQEALPEALLQGAFDADDGLRALVLTPGDDWTLSDLTALCAAAALRERGVDCVLRR